MLKTYIEENSKDIIFYRYSFRRMIYLAFILLILNFCIIGMLYLRLFNIPQAPTFATTSDGRLIEIKPE